MKRLLFMFLFGMIFLVGCGLENSEDEGFTFSVLYNEVEDYPYQDDWEILQEYNSRKNVTLDIRLGDDASFENAIDLNLNSETPPDVILKSYPEAIEKYANQGKLLAISDYEDLMPHYQSYIENHNLENEIDKLRLDNSKYYILPGYQRETQVQQWIYREDVFVEHDIDTPTTYDDLYEALIILKQLYPESTPLTASWGGAHLFSMMGANYGIPAGWSGNRYYNQSEDQWEFAPATDNYRMMYRFLNKCYEAGLLDPDIFTQSNDEFLEKIVNGKALVTVTWISSGFGNWNDQLEDNGLSGAYWSPLRVMESTNGLSKLPPVNRFRKGLVISADAANKPYFEEMIEFLDWAIYSEEGNNLTYWGVEDDTYQVTSNGKEFMSHIISSKNLEGTTSMKDHGYDLIFNLCENEDFEDYKKPDEIVSFLDASIAANETLMPNPNLQLNNDDIELIEIIEGGDLPQYVSQSSVQFITGELDIEDDWQSYLVEIDNLGYQSLENIWNIAWQREGD